MVSWGALVMVKKYTKEKVGKNLHMIFMYIVNNEFSTPESKLYAVYYLKEKYPKKSLKQSKNLDASLLKGDVLRRYKFNDIYLNIIKYGCD